MTDIICETCKHEASEHRHGNCEQSLGGFHTACNCPHSEGWILRLHIAKLDAVVEAARKLDREMSAGGKIIAPESALVAAQELVNAIAALDGTNGLS